MNINNIEDPRLTTQADLPFHFVLSNQSTDLISWGIDWKTKSNVDHCMQQVNVGKFVSQDFGGYHEIPIDGYLKRGGYLKFVKLTNATEQFNIAFRSSILNHLADPWYKKIYGFANVLGRAIGFKNFTIPGTYDCSMIALNMVKKNAMYLLKFDSDLIMSLPNTASPDDIDQCVKDNPNNFTVTGIWQADEGVIC